MKNQSSLLLALLVVFVASSCAATGHAKRRGARTISSTDPQRYPGENRLQFGVPEAQSLLASAYAQVREAAIERGLDWGTVMTVATIEQVYPLDAVIRENDYSEGQKVRTDLDPAFEQSLLDNLRVQAEQDPGLFTLRPSEEVFAYCQEAGISYPNGLFLPNGQAQLRQVGGGGVDPFEYLLTTSLTGSKLSEEQVEFTLNCELIPLLSESDPITASANYKVYIPIDNVFELTSTVNDTVEDAETVVDTVGKIGSLLGRL